VPGRERRQRRPPGDRPLHVALGGAHLHQGEERRPAPRGPRRASPEHRLGLGGDGAFQLAQPFIGREGKEHLPRLQHIGAVELIEQIGEQGQRPRLAGDSSAITSLSGILVAGTRFEGHTGRLGGPADHLAEAGR